MARKLQMFTGLVVILSITCRILYHYVPLDFIFSLSISFDTTLFHLIMRLLVGLIITSILHNRANYNSWWFRVSDAEMKIYTKLGVKKWKNKMPTYDPGTFNMKEHSLDEIAQATCQSEIVHEIIVVLSFLPLLAIIPYGAAAVFIITSVLSACFDMSLVTIQRYNRFRLVKLINKHNKNS